MSDVVLPVHYDSKVTMVTITPKQDKIALTLTDGSFKVYSITQTEVDQVNDSTVQCTFCHDKRIDNKNALRSCCFSNDGRLLALGKENGDIVVSIIIIKLLNIYCN